MARSPSGLPAGSRRRLITVRELARRTGLHPDLVRRLVTLGLLDPETDRPEPLFPSETVVRVRKIVRLRASFGGSYDAVGVILDLLDRIDDLERELRRRRRGR